jgi:hypothetical protein
MNNSLVRTKRSWHIFLRDAGQMLRLAWAARPRPSLIAILFSVIQSLLPVAAAWHGEIDLERYGPIDEYLTQQVPAVIGLPLDERVALPAVRP